MNQCQKEIIEMTKKVIMHRIYEQATQSQLSGSKTSKPDFISMCKFECVIVEEYSIF